MRRERWLLVQALITLAICRVRLRTHNIDKLRVWSTCIGNGSTGVVSLVWAIEVASRRMPGATCLCRALALQRLLSKNGHRAELQIGVEKNGELFGAHAWLVRDGCVLIGEPQPGKFALLTAWPSGLGDWSFGNCGKGSRV